MDILNGKYKIVGVAPVKGAANIVTRKAGGGLRTINLLTINEATADLMIKNGCRFVEKVETVAKKSSADKAS